MRFLAQTRRSRLPWILSVHREEDVPDNATHALILEQGRIVHRGPLSRVPLPKWLARTAGLPLPAAPQRATATHRPRAKMLLRLTRAQVYLDEHLALSGLTLTINRGDCWVVHGHNGSGKSTFIRTLYGDHGVAAGGRIERAGIVPGVPLETFKRTVGLVAPHLQADHPRNLTVAEVVQSGRHASIGLVDAPSSADRSAARRALAFFGMEGFEARPLEELSYGQLRRVLFARAWVGKRPLLLLDEPYSGLDAPTRRALMLHLDELISAGTTVVIATHNREEWPVGATHELALSKGSPVWCGPARPRHGSRTRSQSR
jgi:molybdate transport system ATP-binding protein